MNSEFLIIGHRGAAGLAPENTLKSIQIALDCAVDAIEVDVYTVENELILMHDDRLDRTTNGTGLTVESPLKHLRSLDAGQGETVPLLSEALDLIDRRVIVNIELKGTGTAKPLAALLDRYIQQLTWNPSTFLVSSFNHHELNLFKSLRPDIRIGALTSSLPLNYAGFAADMKAYSVNAALDFVDEQFVQDAHRRRLKIYVYTVNHPEDARRMQEIGVDGIFTDYPDRIKAKMDNK